MVDVFEYMPHGYYLKGLFRELLQSGIYRLLKALFGLLSCYFGWLNTCYPPAGIFHFAQKVPCAAPDIEQNFSEGVLFYKFSFSLYGYFPGHQI
jgi:hypothetical protein